MKKQILFIFFIAFTTASFGQKYFSKTGTIHFLSEALLEKIEARNNYSYVVVDAQSGQIEWAVLIKGFKFEKALQQVHFNENYMESDKYPKSLFKGKMLNVSDVNFSQNGEYKVNVEGNLTIHGVTKPFSAPALISINNGKIKMSGSFDVKIADYNIKVPSVVKNNISDRVKVTVSAELQALK